MAIDAKDQITHGHIVVSRPSRFGCRRRWVSREPLHLGLIEAAAFLHDMGKLALLKYILNKPGPLNRPNLKK